MDYLAVLIIRFRKPFINYFPFFKSFTGQKYGGYNGWSDDVIDDAFDGDPEASWNVD